MSAPRGVRGLAEVQNQGGVVGQVGQGERGGRETEEKEVHSPGLPWLTKERQNVTGAKERA